MLASLRFFAWADTNRGPIRDILVEWDVPGVTAASSGRGKYKNQKPYCQTSDTNPVKTCQRDENVTCSTNEECQRSNLGECVKEEWVSFGNAPSRGCKAGYYEFTGAYLFDQNDPHCNYTIGGQSPQGIDAAQLQELTQKYGLKPGHRYCAFKPRVIVIDNWGWCNGTCQRQADGFLYQGCWGNPDNPGRNVCANGRGENNIPGADGQIKVGTLFDGFVVVAERK